MVGESFNEGNWEPEVPQSRAEEQSTNIKSFRFATFFHEPLGEVVEVLELEVTPNDIPRQRIVVFSSKICCDIVPECGIESLVEDFVGWVTFPHTGKVDGNTLTSRPGIK